MWLWPTFARNDALKRGVLTGAVVVLAVVLLFVVAPRVQGSTALTLTSLAVFILIGVALRFVPAAFRLRTIRRAAAALRAAHPDGDVLVANVVRVPPDRTVTSRDGFQTQLFRIGPSELSWWSPENLDAPLLTVPRGDVIAAEPDTASSPRLRLTVAPRGDDGGSTIVLTAYRPTGSSAATRETVQELARRLHS